MTYALRILHFTLLIFVALSLQILLHAHFTWAPDILIGLAVAFVWYLRWDGVGLLYALAVWVLSFIPYYPREAMALLVCIAALVLLKKLVSVEGWIYIVLYSFFGVLLFYVIVAPGAILTNIFILMLSGAIAAIYALIISWYLKHTMSYVESL